jgi:GSH-dependent disulfide-bond oxidoreductase
MPRTIALYFWPTPNGKKITILLEEAELPYNLAPVDITAGEQFDEEFLKISPNNKMPAIVDPEGPEGEAISVFESGAILVYLAEKTGRFMPSSPRQRYEALQWLMFQVSSVGPMLGQVHHFRGYAPEEIPYAVDRYTNEATRLYEVMDTRLSQRCALVLSPASVESLSLFTPSKPMLLQYPPLTAFSGRAQPLRMPLSDGRWPASRPPALTTKRGLHI